MKKLILSILMLSTYAMAGNDQGGGGGDPCENRIVEISHDIQSWISKEGSKSLVLPKGTTHEVYAQSMQRELGRAKVKCVSSGDQGYPVQVNGTAKVCRFERSASTGQITCDFTKFQSLSESDQYVLIHHEYAGLAGIEKPNGASSTYTISNQLAGFLENQVVKKLVIRPSTQGWKKVSDDAIIMIFATINYMIGPEMDHYQCIRKPTLVSKDGSIPSCQPSKDQDCTVKDVTEELRKTGYSEIAQSAADSKSYYEKISGMQKSIKFDYQSDETSPTLIKTSTIFIGTDDGTKIKSMTVLKNKSWTSPRIDLNGEGPLRMSSIDELVCTLK